MYNSQFSSSPNNSAGTDKIGEKRVVVENVQIFSSPSSDYQHSNDIGTAEVTQKQLLYPNHNDNNIRNNNTTSNHFTSYQTFSTTAVRGEEPSSSAIHTLVHDRGAPINESSLSSAGSSSDLDDAEGEQLPNSFSLLGSLLTNNDHANNHLGQGTHRSSNSNNRNNSTVRMHRGSIRRHRGSHKTRKTWFLHSVQRHCRGMLIGAFLMTLIIMLYAVNNNSNLSSLEFLGLAPAGGHSNILATPSPPSKSYDEHNGQNVSSGMNEPIKQGTLLQQLPKHPHEEEEKSQRTLKSTVRNKSSSNVHHRVVFTTFPAQTHSTDESTRLSPSSMSNRRQPPGIIPLFHDMDNNGASNDVDDESSALVDVDVYGESRCGDTTNFIHNQLFPVWTEIPQILSVKLHMFGKATCNPKNGSAEEDFICQCQHGKRECLLNSLMNCIIDAYPKTSHHFPVIRCIQGQSVQKARNCVTKFKMDIRSLMKCAKSPKGRSLHAKEGIATKLLHPGLYYVPWILIDGQRNEAAQRHLKAEVCKAYIGPNRQKYC